MQSWITYIIKCAVQISRWVSTKLEKNDESSLGTLWPTVFGETQDCASAAHLMITRLLALYNFFFLPKLKIYLG